MKFNPAARQDIQDIAARCFDAMEITREIDHDGGSIRTGSPRRYATWVTPSQSDALRRNVYDPRVRQLVRATGKPDLFPELKIPRSTIAGWLRGEFKPALGAETTSRTQTELHAEIAKLKRRVQVLAAPARYRAHRVPPCKLPLR